MFFSVRLLYCPTAKRFESFQKGNCVYSLSFIDLRRKKEKEEKLIEENEEEEKIEKGRKPVHVSWCDVSFAPSPFPIPVPRQKISRNPIFMPPYLR